MPFNLMVICASWFISEVRMTAAESKRQNRPFSLDAWLIMFAALTRLGHPCARASPPSHGTLGQILEAREAVVEEEFDFGRGTVAVLLDEQVGQVVHPLHLLAPFVEFGITLFWLA